MGKVMRAYWYLGNERLGLDFQDDKVGDWDEQHKQVEEN
jgi:hypothetical protein